MFSQNAVKYLDKNSCREIEENEWLKEEVRGSLAYRLSWQFRFEIQWPTVISVSSVQFPVSSFQFPLKAFLGNRERLSCD